MICLGHPPQPIYLFNIVDTAITVASVSSAHINNYVGTSYMYVCDDVRTLIIIL